MNSILLVIHKPDSGDRQQLNKWLHLLENLSSALGTRNDSPSLQKLGENVFVLRGADAIPFLGDAISSAEDQGWRVTSLS
jgi:hypothetical protein